MPFVDQNLQLQVTDPEQVCSDMVRSNSPIYSHFMGDPPSISNLELQVNEPELYKAIRDAEQAYKAWELMKNQLLKKLKSPN